jgi:tetratricopeptide (TPR) repeat protein
VTQALTHTQVGAWAERALDVLIIPLVCLIVLSNILDYAAWQGAIYVLLLVASGVYLARLLFSRALRSHEIRLNAFDLCITLLVSVECTLYFASSYRANSFYFLLEALFLFLFYWLVRVNLRHEYQVVGIFIFLTILGLCISQVAVYRWLDHYRQLKLLGFADVTDFRASFNLLTPARSSIAEWSSIFLALLPFPIALYFRYRNLLNLAWGFWLPVYALLLTLASTLSRGIYCGTVVFFLAVVLLTNLFRLLPLKTLSIAIGGLFIALILTLYLTPLRQPVLTTSSVFKTASQLRSAQGRLVIWRSASNIIKDHPFFGVGANNFPLKYLSYKAEQTGLVARPSNVFLHLLIEKGLIGLFAVCLVVLSFLWSIRTGLLGSETTRVIAMLYGATFLALVVRDLSYSSIVTNKGVILLLTFMSAHLAGRLASGKNRSRLSHYEKPFVVVVLLVSFCLFFLAARRYQSLQFASAHFRNFSNQLIQKRYESAAGSIEEAIRLAPERADFLANRGHLLARTIHFAPADFAENKLVIDGENAERVKRAITSYRQALELNPGDDWYYNNLGWLHSYLQEQEESIECMKRAINLDGDNTIHHLSLGLLYERYHQPQLAYPEYQKAVQNSPSVLDSEFFADLRRRNSHAATEIIERVTDSLENAIGADSDPLIQAKLGKMYLFKGSIHQAIELLRESTRQMPTLHLAWLNLGEAYEQIGAETEMILCYRKAAFINPAEGRVWERLGKHWYRKGQLIQTAESYRRALTSAINITSSHAGRSLLIYMASDVIRNDAIPQELLSFCRPKLDAADICIKLKDVYHELGDEKASDYFGLQAERLKVIGN